MIFSGKQYLISTEHLRQSIRETTRGAVEYGLGYPELKEKGSMKLANHTQSDAIQSSTRNIIKMKKPEQRYGYGLGHFLKFKQRYLRPSEKENNQSFELGYN